MIPSLVLFLERSGTLKGVAMFSCRCPPFFVASVLITVLSAALAYRSGWRIRGSGRNSIELFFSTFLSRYFIGELAVSVYGLFIFILFAVILTAWLPDAIENGQLWFFLGNTLYFLAIVFATAFVYPAPKGRPSVVHPKTPYLVYGLSVPSRNNPWSNVTNFSCEEFRKNGTGLNINPLYSAIYYHAHNGPLKTLYLLITDDGHLSNWNHIRHELVTFFDRASQCLKREGTPVKFRIEWPNGDVQQIGSGGRIVKVKFVKVGDSNNVRGIFNAISKSEISELIQKNSDEVTFHLTGGTATMSIAMMLHAIKGDTHAEYAKQRIFNVEPKELIVPVDMDIFDLEDLVRELREYFERQYERKI